MQPSPARLSARAIKIFWWLGTASLAFALFIKITSELLEHEVSGVDRAILIGLAKTRTPWLTVMAVEAASLYLTVAILVCRHLQRTGHQIAILAMTVEIILLVGTSRIYLGVHYPSDVASGISLGTAWALLLAGAFRLFLPPRSPATDNSPLD